MVRTEVTIKDKPQPILDIFENYEHRKKIDEMFEKGERLERIDPNITIEYT